MVNSYAKELLDFLDKSPSAFHAVDTICDMLEGYTKLNENEKWNLVPGGKYYVTRGGSAVIAFRIPSAAPKGFLMTASHSDRPTFKIKENAELSGADRKSVV